MNCKQNEVWWKHLPNLICSHSIIPDKNSGLNVEINSITRLVIIIFLVFSVFDIKYALLFLLISNIFIILYYLQKSKEMSKNKESYNNPYVVENYTYATAKDNSKTNIRDPNAKQYCNSCMIIDGPNVSNSAVNNPEWISPNQRLVGGPNPKTKINPIIAAPSNDLNYWKANNLVVNSAINDVSNIDVHNSGYAISTCCPKPYECTPKPFTKENYTNFNNEMGNTFTQELDVIEPTLLDPLTNDNLELVNSGLINLSCGYNPQENLKVDLPSNLTVGNCQKSKEMTNFNNNIFTQTIQPGVYMKTDVNQPINSNIGISFTQQIPPTTEEIINGEVLFTEQDPLVYGNVPKKVNCVPRHEVNESNVYDPRFSGYGTSYRSYIDDTTGQPRYYYDDVDAIRMPNYIVRSNIDTLPFADQYGPIPEGDGMGNQYNANIRHMVHDAFTDAAITHRTDIQQSAMRKINAGKWQQRLAPISTSGQRMLGGGKNI
tara:strand:+ start:1769 stop:3232 length:1464 start_codon:yes stop_codon:yes gene_type:complete